MKAQGALPINQVKASARYYSKKTETRLIEQSRKYFSGLKDHYRGKRCFLIGNGPSLNRLDLTCLKNEFTIGSNYLFLNYKNMGYLPNILTVVNFLVAQQKFQAFHGLEEPVKIFPFFLSTWIKPDQKTFFLNAVPVFDFSKNITEWISWQSTVTFFNMQIAYHLGFDEVYLIGMDHDFIQPQKGEEGRIIRSKGDDPNHFRPDYFGKGFKWQKADTMRMERVYGLAREAFEKKQRKIYNATPGGRLELFDRVVYGSLFEHREDQVRVTGEI